MAKTKVRSAVPVPDLTPIDTALRGDAAALKAAVKQVRPADLGRDLYRGRPDHSPKIGGFTSISAGYLIAG